MKRKNILALIAVIAVFAMVLTGCGKKDAPEASVPVEEQVWGLADWHLSAEPWSSNNGASVTLNATPETYYESVTATFVARLEGEEIASAPCEWDGEHYSAMLDLNAADGYCYYLVWENGATRSDFEVNTPANPQDQRLINLDHALTSYCEMAVETSKLDGSKLTITKGAAQIRLPLLSKDGSPIGFASTELVLSSDEQEIDRQSFPAPEVNAMGTYEVEIKGVSFTVPELQDDQQLKVTLVITLTDGQTLTAPGGTWFYTDGQVVLAVG